MLVASSMRSSIALLPFLLFACGDGSGADRVLVTYTANVDITQSSSSGPLAVNASFGDPDNILLPDDVVVTAAVRDVELTLGRRKDFYTQKVINTFGGALAITDPVEGDEVVVTVTLGKESAIASATLPAPFAIDSTTGVRGGDITLTWSPSNRGGMSWEVLAAGIGNHPCSVGGYPAERGLEDTGTATISTAGIGAMGMGCGFTLALHRTRAGMQDGFADGNVVAIQRRTF
jgi:hypothetical protein